MNTKIIIAIQARSTSTRLPNKVLELIDGKEILQHVLDAAEESCLYINKYSSKNKTTVKSCLVVPHNDPIVEKYKHKTLVFEGPENDVLSRYMEMFNKLSPDFIVRVTSDCPLLPSYLISKCINIATKGNYDYVSNVDENLRTCVDGHDVEVVSARALMWLDQNAKKKEDREHVTQYIRSSKIPPYFKIAHVIGHLYQPGIKLSVDTKEDLDRVREEYSKVKKCIEIAIEKDGENSVYRI